jgi:U3 small nucleolar RNA-associated protein 22
MQRLGEDYDDEEEEDDDEEGGDDKMINDAEDDEEEVKAKPKPKADMMVMMNENKKVWYELKKKGHLYKPPTHDEMMSLMEADTLFNSNLFRLQLNELLAEVKVNPAKTSAIEKALHKLHEILNSMKSHTVGINLFVIICDRLNSPLQTYMLITL